MKMHPVEQFIHHAKHSTSSEVRVTNNEPKIPKEKTDPQMEKRAKLARRALLEAIDKRPRLENALEKAGTDLLIRHGKIESRYDAAV